jgi:hypothetical protein
MAIKPQSTVLLIERANHSVWENANLTAIRLIGAVAAISAAFLVLKYLLFGIK